MQDVALIAASYLLVSVVESLFFDASYQLYYLALLLSTTLVTYLCYITRTRISMYYSVMQLILGALYLVLLTDYYLIGDYLLYSAVINFSLILKAFELAIIVNGAAHAVSAISGWLRLTSRFRCHHH